MRRALVRAAARRFAEDGFDGASLGSIAADAGTSVGNLYKYFENKEALFVAAVPPALAEELTTLLVARVRSLGSEKDAFGLPGDHPHRRAGAALAEFAAEHRDALVFLLLRARGTAFEGFDERIARMLEGLAAAYARRAHGLVLASPKRRSLLRFYRAFVRTCAAVVAEEPSRAAIERGLSDATTHHLAGLGAFFASCGGERGTR